MPAKGGKLCNSSGLWQFADRCSWDFRSSLAKRMGALIAAITNPGQPCPIRHRRGVSPREATDIIPGRNQGSLITAITNPCDNAHLAHGMSPVTTGSRGPSGPGKTAPKAIARENGQCAWSSGREHKLNYYQINFKNSSTESPAPFALKVPL